MSKDRKEHPKMEKRIIPLLSKMTLEYFYETQKSETENILSSLGLTDTIRQNEIFIIHATKLA